MFLVVNELPPAMESNNIIWAYAIIIFPKWVPHMSVAERGTLSKSGQQVISGQCLNAIFLFMICLSSYQNRKHYATSFFAKKKIYIWILCAKKCH